MILNTPHIGPHPEDPDIINATGEWTLKTAQACIALLEKAPSQVKDIDGREITRLDSTGAMLLSQLATRTGLALKEIDVRPEHQALMNAVRQLCETPPRKHKKDYGFRKMLALQTSVKTLFQPRRFRVTSTFHHMEQVGVDAVPLVLLLSFMVGAVIAFLGSTVLKEFGAEVYVVELVGIAFLREFAVLLTAILLAGRTASAFTAQIGAMQSGEEIDAIRTLGLDPIELLVLPRLFALVLMLPLLTFLAMMAGLAGGMAVCYASLDISPELFTVRLHDSISITHFWVGISKAPIFAIIIALIGCLEGFQVQGTAESVGERTTSSVVQTISLVILIDALAALFFMEMDW
jgi:phospholipid/cholesterol/gamma-HCH transport system permease protein